MLIDVNEDAREAWSLQSVTNRCRRLIERFPGTTKVRPITHARTEELAMTATTSAELRSLSVTSLPNVLAGLNLDELRSIVPITQRKLAAGQHLYRAGQSFHALYLVNSGFIKTIVAAADGREQVTGFRMRGDLMGVESIGMSAHAADAVALDTSSVWELPYPAILAAAARMPELQAQITKALAAEIRNDRTWMLALGTLSAEQRVAAFLLDVAARHEALGFSARHFVLRMSRADIGSFLALKHETVTRALTRLSLHGCIEVNCREIRILDGDALRGVIRGEAAVH